MIKKHDYRTRAAALAVLACLFGCGQSYELQLRSRAAPEEIDASTMVAPDARAPTRSCDAAEECCEADDDCPDPNAHICDRRRGACVQCFSSSDCQEAGDARRCVDYRCRL